MKHSIMSFATAVMLAATSVFAGDFTTCDKVLSQIRKDVEAEPAKVLMIVENAMVANESCACEIVKAAILSSRANEDLVKQIMLTATNVAPNRSALIDECAKAALGITSEGDKEVRSEVSGRDYKTAPLDIRGVYLIPAGGGGIVTEKPSKEDPPKRPPPPPKTNPLSPSTARSR